MPAPLVDGSHGLRLSDSAVESFTGDWGNVVAANSFETLKKVIEGHSVANDFYRAVHEWSVIAVEEDPLQEGECLCGQQDLRYKYTIRNQYTGQDLEYIGSKCVEHFQSSALTLQVNVLRGLFDLRKKMLAGQTVSLNEDFSREILKWLYEEGAFPASQYNNNNGAGDYQFLLDMFNKRNKDEITAGQHKKIRGLMYYTVKPFISNHPALGKTP